MTLTLNYCYQIYPDADQEKTMLLWLETCRRLYNRCLREVKDWYNSKKCLIDRCSIKQEYIIPVNQPFPGYYNQQNALPKLKKYDPYLKAAQSQILQTTVRRLHEAIDFFRQRGYGFPRYKKYGSMRSMLFPQFKSNPITDWQIQIPKIGRMPINLHRPIPEGFLVKQVRVLTKAGKWYAVVCIQSDIDIPQPMPWGHAKGIDLGLESFLTTSDREYIPRPKFFQELQRKLELLQRKLSRKQKRSRNRDKARLKVARIHSLIYDPRKNFHYQTAHKICKDSGMIFVEDLNLVAMNRGMLRKHTLDAAAWCAFQLEFDSSWVASAFGAFLSILENVCFKQGVYFAKVDARGTSQTCPSCGTHTGKKELRERLHKCVTCGYETHRDHAAAEVIRQRGIAALGLRDKENACEEEATGIDSNISLVGTRSSRKAKLRGLEAPFKR
ncbi:MAG: transposase [Prochloraceae cyanobacterium]|nr:transposase [Prochloraceae cyanobacterium]